MIDNLFCGIAANLITDASKEQAPTNMKNTIIALFIYFAIVAGTIVCVNKFTQQNPTYVHTCNTYNADVMIIVPNTETAVKISEALTRHDHRSVDVQEIKE